MKAEPKKGKGGRFLDCPRYESCLDFVAIQNWKSFNCESCPFFKSEVKEMPTKSEKKENTRICSECDRNVTISPKHSLCPSCMAQRSNKSRPKKKVPASTKRKDTVQATQGINKAEIGQPRANFEIVISGKYSQVLKEVEKLAEEQIRSIDEQIVFILKNYLKGVKESQKA